MLLLQKICVFIKLSVLPDTAEVLSIAAVAVAELPIAVADMIAAAAAGLELQAAEIVNYIQCVVA